MGEVTETQGRDGGGRKNKATIERLVGKGSIPKGKTQVADGARLSLEECQEVRS
jgi:hypothetical protein